MADITVTAVDAELQFYYTPQGAPPPAVIRTLDSSQGLRIVLQLPSSKLFYFCTGGMKNRRIADSPPAASGLPNIAVDHPVILDASEVEFTGAPGAETESFEFRFSIANTKLSAGGTVQDFADHVRGVGLLGARVTVFAAVAGPDNLWYYKHLFVGNVKNVDLTQERIEIRSTQYRSDIIQIPTKRVMPDSLNYGTEEGNEPTGGFGAVIPVWYGRFNLGGIDTAYATTDRKVAFGSYGADTVAGALGMKIPMLPLPMLSDFWYGKSGTLLTHARHVLLACGDRETRSPDHHWIPVPGYEAILGGYQDPADTGYLGESPVQVNGNTEDEGFVSTILWTWHQEAHLALPFMLDRDWPFNNSPELYEANYGRAGVYAKSWHTTKTSKNSLGNAIYFARSEPNWAEINQGLPARWVGTIQSVALKARKLGEIGGTTGTIPFTSYATLTNSQYVFDDLPNHYTTVPYINPIPTGRICIELPSVVPPPPDAGEVIHVSLWWIAEGPSTHIRCAWRHHPNYLGAARPYYGTVMGADNISVKHDPTVANNGHLGSCVIWKLNGYNFSHGVPQWDFREVDNQVAYPLEAVFWSGSTNDFKLYRVWLQVVFRMFPGGKVERRVPFERPKGGIRRDARGRPVGAGEGAYGTKYYGPTEAGEITIQSASDKPMGQQQLYLTPCGPQHRSDGRWLNTTATAIVENPASVALHSIDAFLAEYGYCETTLTNFGSFNRAYNQLNAMTTAYAMVIGLTETMTLRAFLDEVGRHSMSFVQKQPEAGALGIWSPRWRMFVDTDDPANDCSERLWRGGATYILPDDVYLDTLEVQLSPLELVRNRFILKYGWHAPTQTYAAEAILNETATTLSAGEGNSAYMTACGDSQTDYADPYDSGPYVVEETLEFPWIWQKKTAHVLLRWHADCKRQRRVAIKLTGGVNLLDVEVGHVVRLDDGFSKLVGQYPGKVWADGTTPEKWSVHYFNVVRKAVELYQGALAVRLELVERFRKADASTW